MASCLLVAVVLFPVRRVTMANGYIFPLLYSATKENKKEKKLTGPKKARPSLGKVSPQTDRRLVGYGVSIRRHERSHQHPFLGEGVVQSEYRHRRQSLFDDEESKKGHFRVNVGDKGEKEGRSETIQRRVPRNILARCPLPSRRS